eukprot:g37154.t1
MNGRTLRSIDMQRDLGVQVDRSLKVAVQVDKVVKKAYSILAFIGRGIEYKDRHIMLQLYRTLVRPHLEYCMQFWSLHYQKDVDALERVQKRFTRTLPGMEDFSNEEKLDRLRLFSLECRRSRGDLKEVYKIVNGVESMNIFPRVEGSITRGHIFKVQGEFKKDVQGKFFTIWVVSAWHALPEEVVEANAITAFKKHLDKYTNRKGIEGYTS